MSRIQQVFTACKAENRACLVPYLTAGDPHPDHTVALMHALVRGGADVIELGVPFSDPMADGPTIQLACERALKAGTHLRGVLEMVRDFRRSDDRTPVVLMGYLNPIESMGSEHFAEQAAAAGVDGVLAVDLSVEEWDSLQPALHAQGLDCIFLMSPTTSLERAAKMSHYGSGYLYYVSLKGVTGSAALDSVAVARRLAELRGTVELPLAVGFGIRTAEQVAQVADVADGVVVGSALVQCIADAADNGDNTEQMAAKLEQAARDLRAGIDRARQAA